VAVATSKSNPNKPMKGQFWRGEEIKRVRGLYNHIRRRLQERKLLKKVKELKGKEKHKVNQQPHIIGNQIVACAKQFPKPVIVMENLNGIRGSFKKSKRLNRRFHSLPFRRLQIIVEYKALLQRHRSQVFNEKKQETPLKHAIDAGMLPKSKKESLDAQNSG
jgi:IS605 OrfB family transposase